jgi:hypothetical protein
LQLPLFLFAPKLRYFQPQLDCKIVRDDECLSPEWTKRTFDRVTLARTLNMLMTQTTDFTQRADEPHTCRVRCLQE